MDYHTFCEIKRLHSEERLSAGQIADQLDYNIKTVRKWLKKERFEQRKTPVRASVLDPYKDAISNLLGRYNYTATQIYNMLVEEGYTGGKSTVRRYVAKVRPSKKKAYLMLTFAPGEAAQVDFGSCGTVQVGDTRRKLYVFVMTLCYSRMMYAEFILRQCEEHFLQCHRNAFEYFKGIPNRIMVDNCKVAISSRKPYESPVVNRFYADMAAHYGFEVTACGVRKPNEKGRVERCIGYIKQNFLNGPEPTSFESANSSLRYWLENTANCRIHGVTKKQPQELFENELKHLVPLPLFPYDCGIEKDVNANSQFRVTFESNRYSVPSEFSQQALVMKKYPDKLLFYHDKKLIATHWRNYERNKDIEDPDHISAALADKRNAKNQKLLKDFLRLSPRAEDYYNGLKEKRLNAIPHIRKIMALLDVFGREKLVRALEDALEWKAFSCEYIHNYLAAEQRKLPGPSPLKLTRKQDYLELDFKQQDLGIYNKVDH